jgi:hypothetical protein
MIEEQKEKKQKELPCLDFIPVTNAKKTKIVKIKDIRRIIS